MNWLNFFRFLDATDFDRFLRDYAWIFALALVGVIFLVVLILLLARPKKGKARKVDANEYFLALGGGENVISHLRKGSRIELVLKDYSKVDKEKLRSIGVDSFLLMSNKLTLVVQGDAEKVEKTLFGESKE